MVEDSTHLDDSSGVEAEYFLSVEDLLEQDAPVAVHEIPGLGKVKLQGLSRDDAHRIAGNKDSRKSEIQIVSWGMLEPGMTYQQVETWYRKPGGAGQIQGVVEAVNRLSGIDDEAEVAAVDRFREGPE